MPSIEAVEQFKTIVQSLAREPEIRAEMGLPADEISPPESQMDDDLAGLLGAMPTDSPASGAPPDEPGLDTSPLDDLFAAPVPNHDEELAGPSLDELLGPAPSMPDVDEEVGEEAVAAAPAEDFGGFEDFAEPAEASEGPEESLEEPASFEEPAEESVPDAEEDFDFGGQEALGDLAGMDDLFSAPPSAPATTDRDKRSQAGVSPEELTDAFFDTPGEDLFGSSATQPQAEQAEDEFEFSEGMPETDFPELAGFADTKEEDVEAFDAMGEADEFQLGDFESQFGITADDHTDAELLNPAQAIDLDVEAAQRSLSLSEEEFQSIQRSLGSLPLNLRLAVEELIGEKEVVFDDLDKVVRLLVNKAPPRTLASAVGKILGRKIVIPPGFEKGTGADLEALHGTLWFNLKTIMFPVLRVAFVISVIAGILVVLGWNFLMRPLKANDLYDRGLAAVRQNDGEKADDLFAQAWYYWPAQDRFFQYANAYQDTGDYDRARRKYLELLKPSVKPYRDEDKAQLDERFVKPMGPLPNGLEGQALADKLKAKRAAADDFYAYVAKLLAAPNSGANIEGEIPGEVILGNPDPRGILEYSRFETDFGFDGLDREGHFRRADAVLGTLLAQSPGSKDGLLRRADNFLAWSKALSSKQSLDNATASLGEYLRLYGYDSPVTWRFVKVFILEDQEGELLKLRDRIAGDKHMAMDGEIMAQMAGWFLDRKAQTDEMAKFVPPAQKTIEEEYGVRPKVTEPPDVPEPSPVAGTTRSVALAEEGGAEGAAAGGSEAKPVELKPPHKYPYTSEPFQPDYLDKVDTLLLRAMDEQKSLPELHYELSRYYRDVQAKEDERRALAAADAYFQRLEPRKTRLNDRPALRVATSNRIGEVFDESGQPMQAEKYYLEAQKIFESFRDQGLVSLDAQAAQVYRNLGNLYYHQTPGVEAVGKGSVPGAWDQALKLFETSEGGHEEDKSVTYRIGVIQYEKRNFDQAVKRFFTLDRDGNKGEPSGRVSENLLYSMGNTLFRTGNFASAEGYYRELLEILRERRSRITDFDPVGRKSHKALAQRLYETWNNLAAAEYLAGNTFRSGTPEFHEALAALTTARAQSMILGRDLYEDKKELDITTVDQAKLLAIRADEAQVLAKTRVEKGLVEANLEVLSLLETAPPARKAALAQHLEIFARIPLEIDQADAP